MTPRQTLERELEEARRRFRSLMDNCVDAMIIIDEDGLILDFNPAAESIFQYRVADVMGKNVSMLMPEPYRSAHDGYIHNYLATGEARIIGIGREVVGRRRDGSTFPMELSVGEMPEGRARNFIGIVRDISQRRSIENQLQQASKMEAVGQLTGGIAHDFNNILAILMMDLEMLADLTEGQEDSAELVAEALGVARTGADLTQRLLAFSRRQTLNPTRLIINELVLSITGLLRRTLGEAIRIDTVGPQNLWPAMIDRGQLENALVNLAINARDAMPDGGHLSIRCENVSVGVDDVTVFGGLPPGDYVRLAFADTGSGMSEEVAHHAFEPFFTTKGGRHGTGLGLSMVYGFVKQSGGNVTIDSAPGAGTTVSLYFPRTFESGETARPATSAARLPAGTERILVVEDDSRLRERTAAALQALGYRTDTAADGATALDMLGRGERPALLLTDIVMPGGVDGPALAAEALALHPSLKIVFMTGYSDASAALDRAIRGGAQLLHKPFSREALALTIRKQLDG